MTSDQWDWWRRQLAGEYPETSPGDPKSGFYRDTFRKSNGTKKREKAHRYVAIWRDESGDVNCRVSEGYEPKHIDEIDELFSSVARDAISAEDYQMLAGVELEGWENVA
jgi:hypothetical protein